MEKTVTRVGRTAEKEPSRRMMTKLDRAEALFDELSKALATEARRLKRRKASETEDDDNRPKVIADLARQTQKALLTVLEIEARVMKCEPGAALAGAIDLDGARNEIESRLARLVA
ncbi:MAG: hypothetical protein AAF074_06205 [Pseudomonadota bacterium]